MSEKPEGTRELTLRAVIAAVLVAIIMGASYPYIVLKLGFGPNVSVVAAFFGFMMLAFLFKDFNRWENNIVQTAGTSAAQTAFMCVLLAAFDMLRAKGIGFEHELVPWESFIWLTCAGLLGVLLAIPLRQHFIVDEKLTYADGVAAAETLVVLDSRGKGASQAVAAMTVGTVASAANMIVREDALILKWIPETYKIGSALVQKMGGGISLSLLSIGSGMLVGLRINISMMIGGFLAWVIAPYVLIEQGWIAAAPKKLDVLFWVMWPAVGMLVAGGLTALALRWRILIKTFSQLSGARVGGDEFPLRWVMIGVAITAAALMGVQKLLFDQALWVTAVAIVLSLPLMLVGLRVLGETNWGPISSLSNMMQGIFAGILPGQLNANMAASGTTGTIAVSSEAIMQDYKAGHIIGSTPRYLAFAQLAAVPIGAAAVSWMYPYLRDTYGIVGETAKLSSPISARWAGFAEILQKGVAALPPYSMHALAVFTVLGVLFTVLENRPSLRTYIPSPTGIGIGMLVPFSVVATMFLGGVIGAVWTRKDKASSDAYSVPLASGLIAGEAIVAVIIPLLIAIGLIAVD